MPLFGPCHCTQDVASHPIHARRCTSHGFPARHASAAPNSCPSCFLTSHWFSKSPSITKACCPPQHSAVTTHGSSASSRQAAAGRQRGRAARQQWQASLTAGRVEKKARKSWPGNTDRSSVAEKKKLARPPRRHATSLVFACVQRARDTEPQAWRRRNRTSRWHPSFLPQLACRRCRTCRPCVPLASKSWRRPTQMFRWRPRPLLAGPSCTWYAGCTTPHNSCAQIL